MLDSIYHVYHMTLKKYLKLNFGVKKSRFSSLLRNIIMDVIT